MRRGAAWLPTEDRANCVVVRFAVLCAGSVARCRAAAVPSAACTPIGALRVQRAVDTSAPRQGLPATTSFGPWVATAPMTSSCIRGPYACRHSLAQRRPFSHKD